MAKLGNIKKISLAILVLLACFFIGCGKKEEVKKIDVTKTEEVIQEKILPKSERIHIAIGGMITPKEGYAYYRQFLDYIGKKLGKAVDFIDKTDYAEINNMISAEEVDIAFVCSQPYVQGKEEFGMELLVAPVAYGKTVYYSYIIVPADSAAQSLKDLQGKTFAFMDPLSNSGKLVPTYMLAKIHQTPEAFFSSYVYTHGHDKTIKMVAQGIVDAGAVDSLIWEYQNTTDPRYTSKTKIIEKSEPCGIPPVVVRPGLDAELKEKIKKVFLNAHNDKEGQAILSGMKIDKFVEVSDKEYDFIREMRSFVSGQKKEE